MGVFISAAKHLIRNPNGWNDSLKNNYYKYPAIVPPMKWIDSIPPIAPLLRIYSGIETDKGDVSRCRAN